MKVDRLLILIIVLMLSNSNFVHSQDHIAGVYRRSSGNPEGGNTFFVMKDHRFVVAFFGGVITGTWAKNGDQINFKPYVPEHQFYIYGRHNKDLKTGSRVYFQGFEDESTYIGLAKVPSATLLLKSVFNPNPNCVDYPSVTKFGDVPAQISFSNQARSDADKSTNSVVYTFDNPEKYNDFVAYFQKEEADRRPFSARIKEGKLYFGEDEKGSAKHPLPTSGEDYEFIKEILAAPSSMDKVFYNPFYKSSVDNVKDINNWKFDEKKNAFINIHNYVNGEENKPDAQDAYNKMNIVYQFNILKLNDKKVKPFSVDQKPLFVAKCND